MKRVKGLLEIFFVVAEMAGDVEDLAGDLPSHARSQHEAESQHRHDRGNPSEMNGFKQIHDRREQKTYDQCEGERNEDQATEIKHRYRDRDSDEDRRFAGSRRIRGADQFMSPIKSCNRVRAPQSANVSLGAA